jgi:CRP-like cAMP-binding protein
MTSTDAMVRLLQTVPFFAGLDSRILKSIAARCQSKPLRAGQVLFMAGDPCQQLYILESGCVKFYRASAEGREQILKVFDRPGDSFCIPSAFRTGRHIVSARAAAETRLRFLDVDTVNRIAQEHPSMALKLVATAGEHMTHLVNLAEDLSLKTATARLAKYLSELAMAEGAEQGKEIQLSRDRLPEEELASMLGTVRVHISRSLRSLVRAGAIDLDRKFIRIRDLTVLKQISKENSGLR